MAKNVVGGELVACSHDPLTGFYRTGCCETGADDHGLHLFCVEVSAEFLAFSQMVGNDLSTPLPGYGFPGLKPGDRWCLCVKRWLEAAAAGHAPAVHLAATHVSALEFVDLATLQQYACDEAAD
ncbi:MAG: DUF2237 family protein [Planctomycetota bacterium]|jgi:uncharacterized protein (DUF2237 family)